MGVGDAAEMSRHPRGDTSCWALALLLCARCTRGQPGFVPGLKITSPGTLGEMEVISVPALQEHPPLLAPLCVALARWLLLQISHHGEDLLILSSFPSPGRSCGFS